MIALSPGITRLAMAADVSHQYRPGTTPSRAAGTLSGPDGGEGGAGMRPGH